MPDDLLQRDLDAIDRGDRSPGTMREGRKEFQQPVTRPDDRPQAGQTLLERGKAALFGTRKSDRDQRKESR